MAILLPVLVLLAIGVGEYGRVYITALKIANAATAGAQYGSQNTSTADSTAIRQVARDDAGDQTLSVSTTGICRCPGSDAPVSCTTTCTGYGVAQYYVRVTATKNYEFLFKYPGLPPIISISRTATFRTQ